MDTSMPIRLTPEEQRPALLAAVIMALPLMQALKARAPEVAELLPEEFKGLLPGVANTLAGVLRACGLDPSDDEALRRALAECQTEIVKAVPPTPSVN